MWVVGGLVVIGVVVLVVVLIRKSTAPATAGATIASTSTSTSTPRQILDERYARGDLTTDEYRERIENLGGKLK